MTWFLFNPLMSCRFSREWRREVRKSEGQNEDEDSCEECVRVGLLPSSRDSCDSWFNPWLKFHLPYTSCMDGLLDNTNTAILHAFPMWRKRPTVRVRNYLSSFDFPHYVVMRMWPVMWGIRENVDFVLEGDFLLSMVKGSCHVCFWKRGDEIFAHSEMMVYQMESCHCVCMYVLSFHSYRKWYNHLTQCVFMWVYNISPNFHSFIHAPFLSYILLSTEPLDKWYTNRLLADVNGSQRTHLSQLL